jgi:uncharacterized protein YggE
MRSMNRMLVSIVCSSLLVPLAFVVIPAYAQISIGPEQTRGTQITIPAYGEVTHANDQAHATLSIEEQDKDKATAASRVNLKMKQGLEIVKREDPTAQLKTRGYYTYPVYPNDTGSTANNKPRQVIGWRVGQSLDVTTTNLGDLPKMVAAAQSLLSLNGLQFDLTPATSKKLDQQRIEAAYQNLSERVATIAKAMGRNASDAVVESVDFETSNAYAPRPVFAPRAFAEKAVAPAPVEEPSFEPGETTQELRLVGKIKFK